MYADHSLRAAVLQGPAELLLKLVKDATAAEEESLQSNMAQWWVYRFRISDRSGQITVQILQITSVEGTAAAEKQPLLPHFV